MKIKELVLKKLANKVGSPELKEEVANLAQDALEADDLFLLMGPMNVFHEGFRYNTSQLSDEEYEELLGFIPNVVIDDEGYIDNVEYLTEAQAYRLMKRWGILSLVARAIEAKEVAFDQLWELAKKHPDASFEKQEAVVLRGIRAINTWDVAALWATPLTWTLENQEGITCEISAEDDLKDLFDYWGVTALVKEFIG